MAALGYRFPNASTNGIQFYCAGSLITRSHVISSAHCLNSYLKKVRLGEYDLSAQNGRSNPMDFAIEWTKVHENYVSDIILNDIGIIKLRHQAPINGENVHLISKFFRNRNRNSSLIFIFVDRIRPICLPLHHPLRSADFIGYSPFVAGWGSTSFQGPQSNILRDTPVKVIPTIECEKSYKSKFSVQVFDDRIICAGGSGHDACQGDSGGPLMVGVSGQRKPKIHFKSKFIRYFWFLFSNRKKLKVIRDTITY